MYFETLPYYITDGYHRAFIYMTYCMKPVYLGPLRANLHSASAASIVFESSMFRPISDMRAQCGCSDIIDIVLAAIIRRSHLGFYKYPGRYHSTLVFLCHFSAIESIPERNCYGEYNFEKDWP